MMKVLWSAREGQTINEALAEMLGVVDESVFADERRQAHTNALVDHPDDDIEDIDAFLGAVDLHEEDTRDRLRASLRDLLRRGAQVHELALARVDVDEAEDTQPYAPLFGPAAAALYLYRRPRAGSVVSDADASRRPASSGGR